MGYEHGRQKMTFTITNLPEGKNVEEHLVDHSLGLTPRLEIKDVKLTETFWNWNPEWRVEASGELVLQYL